MYRVFRSKPVYLRSRRMELFRAILWLVSVGYIMAFPTGELLNAKENLSNTNQPDRKHEIFRQSTAPFPNLLIPKPKGREIALVGSTKHLIYDNAQKFVVNIFQPKPIIDTISEEEKYGNTGDQFRSIGNMIVGGYESFSDFLNSAVGFPVEAMKQATRKASSYLNSIGAKFVGL